MVEFGSNGRDVRNLVTQSVLQNNGPIADLENMIAAHVRRTGNTVNAAVAPIYGNGGVIPGHISIEAIDDFNFNVNELIPNM